MKKLLLFLFGVIILMGAIDASAQITVQIGTATTTTATTEASPVCNWYRNYRMQFVFLKSELNAVGITCPHDLDQIQFNVTGLPTYAFPNYTRSEERRVGKDGK